MDKRVFCGAGRFTVGLLLSMGLAACGQPQAPAAQAALQVRLAKQFVGSSCRLYPIDDLGQPVGSGAGGFASLSGGELTLSVPSAAPGLVRCSGGRYVDDSDPSGIRSIELPQGFVVEAFVGAGDSSVRVDVFSQVLVDFARRRSAAAGGNFLGYLTAAQRAFDQRYPGVFAGGLSDAGRDLVNGGVANLLNAAAIVSGLVAPDASVLQALIDDLSDGVLDGSRDGVAVTVNGRALRPLDLNAAIRRFRNNQFATYGSTPLPDVATAADAEPIGDITPDTPDNRPPVAVADLFVGLPGQDLVVAAPGVLANDSDPDDDSLQAALIGSVAPELGVLTLDPDGALRFQPDGDGELRVAFSYEISDGGFATVASSEIVLSAVPVVSVADAQVVEAAAGTVDLVFELSIAQNTLAAGDTLQIPVSTSDGTALAGEDYAALSDILVVQAGASVASVTVTVFGDEDAEPDETLSLSLGAPRVFSAELGERAGVLGRATATGTIVTDDFQQPPVAQPDQAQTNEDESISIDVLANDTDDNGDPLIVAGTDPASAAGGTVQFSDAAVVYTPPLDFFGSDSFTYTVSDGALVDTATVSLTVVPVDDPPVAVDDAFSVAEDTTTQLDVLANDTIGPDVGETLMVTGLGPRARGGFASIVNSGAAVSYQPVANDVGIESFTYTVTDSSGSSATATVTVTINGRNDAPVALDVSLSTNEDQPVDGMLAATDVEGQPLYFEIIDAPVDGSITALDPTSGAFTFAPSADFNGTATFTYQAIEGATGASGAAVRAKLASASATVTITVMPVNDAPVAAALAINTDEDVAVSGTLNGSDVDGDAFYYEIVAAPAHGSLSSFSASAGDFTYTPGADYSGGDSFTYRVVEGAPTGGVGAKLSSGVATATVTVAAVNDAPVVADGSAASDEDMAATGSFGGTDVEGDALSYSVVTAPANGSVAISGAGFTYTPNADFNGGDTFTFKANDGTADSNVGTITLTVAAINDAPVVSDGSAAADEDMDATGSFSGSDVDGDALTYSVVAGPSDGSVTISGSGFTYTPNADFSGPDSFTFKANDGSLDSNTGTVTVTIAPINDAPVASDASVTTDEDVAISDSLSATDADGDTLTFTKLTDPANGVVSVASDGSYTYTPDADFNGSDSFSFEASDGTATSNSATQTILVTAVNDAPTVSDASDTTAEDTAISSTLTGSDVDGDTLSFAKVADPTNGTVSIAADGSFTYTPTADFNGSDSFTYDASDGTASSNIGTYSVTVTAVNDVPTFTLTSPADQTVLEDAGATTVSGFVTASDDGDPELSQTISYSLSNDNAGLFSAAPSVDAGGTLSFTPATDANGSATITMIAQDSGGADSAAQTFTVAVTAVNDPPVLETTDFYRSFDSGTVSIDLASHISFGATNESGQTIAAISGVSSDNPDLFAAAPGVSGTVLSFQFAGDALGQSTVMLTIQDDGGTANGGADTTTTALKLWAHSALEFASIDVDGAQPDAAAINPVISGNGRYVVFESGATNFNVPYTLTGLQQIYRRDTQGGTLDLMSVTAAGAIGSADSIVPCVNYDGSMIGFTTTATEFGASAGSPQLVIKDQYDGTVRVVSETMFGNFFQVSAGERCEFSADGEYIAFAGEANSGDGIRVYQSSVFGGGAVEVGIVSTTGGPVPMCDGAAPCSAPSINAAGTHPIAVSYTGDRNDDFFGPYTDTLFDVWLEYNGDGLLIDSMSSGADGPAVMGTRTGDAARGAVDGLGERVVYETAENQAPASLSQPTIVLRQLYTSNARAVVNAPHYPSPPPSPPPSLAPAGPTAISAARDGAYEPRISGDTRFAVWSGSQNELGTPDNAQFTVYVKELNPNSLDTAGVTLTNAAGQLVLTGRVARIHISEDAGVFANASAYPHLDFQGKYIVFQCDAPNVLASGDANGTLSDVFRVLNPLWSEDTLSDFDGDGVLTDSSERALGTNPASLDSDGDFRSDADEVSAADPLLYDAGTADTDPLNPDTDGDTCIDGDEVGIDFTDPNDPASYCGAPGAPNCGGCVPAAAR